MPNIAPITRQIKIVDVDGYMTEDFARWLLLVTNNDLLIGTGSPETNIEANQGRMYMDDSGSAGAILYIKKLADIGGDKTQGWILV